MIYVVLIMMVIFAIASIQTEMLRRAVIYAGIFSLLSSFAYLLYMAPDVAIAEAVIGCTLATIIYLVALTKYKIFRVYYMINTNDDVDDSKVIDGLARFSDYMDLQLDIIDTQMSKDDIIKNSNYDVIIIRNSGMLDIYGDKKNYHFENLADFLNLTCKERITYHFLDPDEMEVTSE